QVSVADHRPPTEASGSPGPNTRTGVVSPNFKSLWIMRHDCPRNPRIVSGIPQGSKKLILRGPLLAEADQPRPKGAPSPAPAGLLASSGDCRACQRRAARLLGGAGDTSGGWVRHGLGISWLALST